MNRRQFLQSLAAIGTALAIPRAALAKASEAEINTAWDALGKAPRTFYVGSEGTLSSEFGVEYNIRRGYLFGLADPPKELAPLTDYIDANRPIERLVNDLFDQAYDDGTIGDVGTWQEWLTSGDDERISGVRCEIEAWLNDGPDDADWELADLTGVTGRGDALHFFREQRDISELFDVDIIEGAHPGSSYYAAELRMDIAEANALAVTKGIPIRFDHDEQML